MRRSTKLAITTTLAVAIATGGGWFVAVSAKEAPRTSNRKAAATSAPTTSATRDGVATLTGMVRLAAVADACARSATRDRPGAVVVRGGIADSNATVRITVPCAVQLATDAGVALSNVTVASGTLNIADTDFGAGSNRITMSNVRFSGDQHAGLLVELSDPGDRVDVNASTVSYPLGIVVQARGARTEPDSGGNVVLNNTTLTATGPDSAGITIVASTRQGRVAAHETTFNAEQVALFADNCMVAMRGKPVDCRAGNLGTELKKQAEQANAQR